MKKMKFYHWGKAFAALLFPQNTCMYCGAPEGALCSRCRAAMASLHRCRKCATFVHSTETEYYRCAGCREKEPPFLTARAALPYVGEFRQNILSFKYQGRTGLRRPLAAILTEYAELTWPDLPFDAIVPIPLHPLRQAERGYNQAELLTEILSAETALPHRPALLTRIRETRRLADLDIKERQKEMQDAFSASPAAKGLRILLVDDIYTTGTTARAATSALLKAGAANVTVLTLAAGKDL